jgi:hypothetical protein
MICLVKEGLMKARMIQVVLGTFWFLVLATLALADTEELRGIQAAIKAGGAHWTVGESWVTRLSLDERRNLLGEKSLELGILEAIDSSNIPLDGYPPPPDAIDWTNKDGHDWVTPIKNQGMCGSCVSFGAVATVESLARIEQNQPDLDIDLSEMHLFNCGGGTCASGWYNSWACLYLKDKGTPDEGCWPYVHVDMPCSDTCSDWQSRAVKITDYGHISGIEACKTCVAVAPIFVSFNVYTDFYYYENGIYEYTWGDYEGAHAVCIVGYDTRGDVPYWIAKNSWGSSWGEDGFFRIKMGECSIETRSSYWMSGSGRPHITELVPTHGGYGTIIMVDGAGFGDQQSGMFNEQDGYCSLITFSGLPGTMVATKYPLWSDDTVKVKFKKLFIDQDGDYLQDANEPFLTMGQLPLDEEYALTVNSIWFQDSNSNDAYDDGDVIDAIFSSNSQTFTLTDEPVIYALIPSSTPPSQPGIAQKVKIIGLNFGATQDTSTLHIGGKTWYEGHPKIPVWQDNKIKFKVPKYGPPFPKYKDVWVTVNGQPSNKVLLEISAP